MMDAGMSNDREFDMKIHFPTSGKLSKRQLSVHIGLKGTIRSAMLSLGSLTPEASRPL